MIVTKNSVGWFLFLLNLFINLWWMIVNAVRIKRLMMLNSLSQEITDTQFKKHELLNNMLKRKMDYGYSFTPESVDSYNALDSIEAKLRQEYHDNV